jgi:hypothetical protein
MHRQQPCAAVEIEANGPSTGLCGSGNRGEWTVNRPVRQWKSRRMDRQQACAAVEIATNRTVNKPDKSWKRAVQ